MGKILQLIKSAPPDSRAERWIITIFLAPIVSLMIIAEDWSALSPQLWSAFVVLMFPLTMGLFTMFRDIMNFKRDRNGKDKDTDD